MSRLKPNSPRLSQPNCNSSSSNPHSFGCGCDSNDTTYGDVFRSNALHKINKFDDICIAYEKINANFKMLADGFYLLGEAILGKEEVAFGFNIPVAFRGNLYFSTRYRKLYVWNKIECKYIPAYGAGSIDDANCPTEDVIEVCPEPAFIPTLEDLRAISEGRSVNLSFSGSRDEGIDGIQEITFVDTLPNSFVGLFIYDKSNSVLKIWSPNDNGYTPAYGAGSVVDPENCITATTTGRVSEKIDADNINAFIQK